MSTTKKSKKLKKNQLQAILNTDHIRQHLLRIGLINGRGEIVSREEYQRRSRRRHRPNESRSKQRYPRSARHQTTTMTPARSMNPNESRSSDNISTERRSRQPLTDRPKQTNKSQTSARTSSANQSSGVKNVILRRNVAPTTMPTGKRCQIRMMYYGPELNVVYDREWFEPNGDEILIMQQHCGGENRIVFRGFVKPNEIFTFESLRHVEYPFALACYINGVVYNRLSVCCEAKCKDSKRIGGRYGQFSIVGVEKELPCRRCRFEQRMKKLTEDEEKSSGNRHQKSSRSSRSRSKSPAGQPTKSGSTTDSKKSPEPTAPRTNNSKTTAFRTASPESVKSRTPSPEPTNSRKSNSKVTSASASNAKPTDSDGSGSDSGPPYRPKNKNNATLTSSAGSKPSGALDSKPNATHKTTAFRVPSPELVSSRTPSPEPASSHKATSAIIFKVKPTESDRSGSDSGPSYRPKNKNNTTLTSSAGSKPSGTLASKPNATHKTTTFRVPSPELVSSRTPSPEPASSHKATSAIIFKVKPTESDRSGSDSGPSYRPKNKNNAALTSSVGSKPSGTLNSKPDATHKATKFRVSSPESVRSRTPSPKPTTFHKVTPARTFAALPLRSDKSSSKSESLFKPNTRINVARTSSTDSLESDTSIVQGGLAGKTNSKTTLGDRTHAKPSISDASSLELESSHRPKLETAGTGISSSESKPSGASSSKPVDTHRTMSARMSSPEKIKSRTPSPEAPNSFKSIFKAIPIHPLNAKPLESDKSTSKPAPLFKPNTKINVARTSSTDSLESDRSGVASRPLQPSNLKEQQSNQPAKSNQPSTSSVPKLDNSDDKDHWTSRRDNPIETHSTKKPDMKPNNQHHSSTKKLSHEDEKSLDDESDDEFKRMLSGSNHRTNTAD